MPCYHPLQGWRSRTVNSSGKRSLVFNRNHGFSDLPVEVPCGQCVGCRLERSRQWAIRCVHEASLYEDNCFITLTYNNETLPPDQGLQLRDFQLFMKKLRKLISPKTIRFFHCGEYGDTTNRPHYHACLFNHDFEDKTLFKVQNGNPLYSSSTLTDLWGNGHALIGAVTFQSAAYVARYIMKKITGPPSEDHYNGRKPEYTTMSRRPGIAADWLKKYKNDVYPSDTIVVNGKKHSSIKFYDTQYEITNPDELKLLKLQRIKRSIQHAENNTTDRLQTREAIQIVKLNLLQRNLEL